jgi:hypothetical protein
VPVVTHPFQFCQPISGHFDPLAQPEAAFRRSPDQNLGIPTKISTKSHSFAA